MLSHALASAAIRRLAIHGSPFGCAGYDVKFYFYSVIVGKGARFRVLWLAWLLAGSLHRGLPLVALIVMSNLTGYLLRSKSHLGTSPRISFRI